MDEMKRSKHVPFYQVNVFLLVTSTFLIFTSTIMMKFYLMDKLDFWSAYFWIVPYTMVILGVLTFVVTVFGFLISGSENRLLLSFYAVLLSICFLIQLFSVFSALELRNSIDQEEEAQGGAVTQEILQYDPDDPSKAHIVTKWDTIQRQMRCCGGFTNGWGYRSYSNSPIYNGGSIPNSCCKAKLDNCGEGFVEKVARHETARNHIYRDGCLEVLVRVMDDDVKPVVIAYAAIGVVMAIVELITVAVAFSYVAQISRKMRQEENMWTPTQNDNHDFAANTPLTHGDTMV
jgi:hypothetical protein